MPTVWFTQLACDKHATKDFLNEYKIHFICSLSIQSCHMSCAKMSDILNFNPKNQRNKIQGSSLAPSSIVHLLSPC